MIKTNKLKFFIGCIQHCVKAFGLWIFDSNIAFALRITCEELDYFCTNNDESKGINELVQYNTVHKIHRLPLFGTRGSLVFDFAIAPYTATPFLYYFLYFTIHDYPWTLKRQ